MQLFQDSHYCSVPVVTGGENIRDVSYVQTLRFLQPVELPLGHIETDTQQCPLWESNSNRGDSL